MLLGLLPGFREVRTSVATGYVWFGFVWLAFREDIQSAGPPTQQLVEMGEALPPIALGVAATFLAYLAGSLSEFTCSNLLIRAVETVYGASRRVRALGLDLAYNRSGWLAFVGRHVLTNGVVDRLSDRGRTGLQHVSIASEGEGDLDRLEKTEDDQLMRQELARLEGDRARARTEADLRLALVPPLIAIIIAMGADSTGWLLWGLVPCLALYGQGLARYEDWIVKSHRLRAFRDTHGLIEPLDDGSGS